MGLEGAETVDEGETVRRIEMGEGGEEVEVEVEVGEGWNPDTAKVQKYEEIWSDEPVPPTSPYVFLTFGVSPTSSTGFIAFIGSHALGVSSESDGCPFQAVRLFRPPGSTPYINESVSEYYNAISGHNEGWEVVYSTPEPENMGSGKSASLISETLTLMKLVASGGHDESGSKGWEKGDAVSLCAGLTLQNRKWTVFDCGNI